MTENIDPNLISSTSVIESSDLPTFPNRAVRFLKAIIVLFCLAIIVIPELPKEYFIALHPVTHKPYFFLRSHIFASELYLLWAFIGFFSIALPGRIICVVVIFSLCFFPISLPYRDKPSLISDKIKSKFWFLMIIVGLLSTCFFYLARASYVNNMSFADGATLPGHIGQGIIFPSEVLTCYFYQLLQFFGGIAVSTFSSLDAIIWGSCIAGGIFVILVFIMVRLLDEGIISSSLLAMSIIGGGYVVTFFGYVETTQLELALMTGFFASAYAANTRVMTNEKDYWEVIALIFASLAFMAHAAGILLFPGVIFMLMRDFDGTLKSFLISFKKLFSLRNALLLCGLIILPYMLIVVEPFYLQGNFGNIKGGADEIMFVPLKLDYTNPPSRFVNYSMFSAWHFFGIFSSVIISCPLAVPLLLFSYYIARHFSITLKNPEKRILWITGISAGCCAFVPVFWNHDFCMWGDWNLAVTYWFPMNLFSWITFYMITRKFKILARHVYGLIVPLILLQAVLCLGILLQLY